MGYQPDDKDEGTEWLSYPDFAITSIVHAGDSHIYQIKLGNHFYPLQFDSKCECWFFASEGVVYFVSVPTDIGIEKVLSVIGEEVSPEKKENWTITKSINESGSSKYFMFMDGNVFEVNLDNSSGMLVCDIGTYRYYFKPTKLAIGKKLEYEDWQVIGEVEHPRLPFF